MPKKLLLAEDSLTIQKVFELAFAQSDMSITSVDNGDDVVRLAGEIAPDLVVVDVTLPGKDGYAVAAELRTGEKTRDIPVLILSGSLAPLDEPRFKASQANGVLFKPFESQELLEKVDGLLHKAAGPTAAEKAEERPAGDERWDFSDVLEEVEEEAGKAVSAPAAAKREGAHPAGLLPGDEKAHGVSFNEFDVSLDEIGPAEAAPAARAVPAPPLPAAHLEGSLAGDAPPAVTDLTPAIEPVEDIEDIEEMEEVEFRTEAPPAAPTKPPPVKITPVVPEAPAAASAPPPSASAPPPADQGMVLPAAFHEQFSARADAIFRAVAAEAVEKAMWEIMDRLTAEVSAKVRESVEAVAWEVIPAAAETLIREEIARIRQKAGKPSPLNP